MTEHEGMKTTFGKGREQKEYSSKDPKERVMVRYSSRRKEGKPEDFRSEVERKYFR